MSTSACASLQIQKVIVDRNNTLHSTCLHHHLFDIPRPGLQNIMKIKSFLSKMKIRDEIQKNMLVTQKIRQL